MISPKWTKIVLRWNNGKYINSKQGIAYEKMESDK